MKNEKYVLIKVDTLEEWATRLKTQPYDDEALHHDITTAAKNPDYSYLYPPRIRDSWQALAEDIARMNGDKSFRDFIGEDGTMTLTDLMDEYRRGQSVFEDGGYPDSENPIEVLGFLHGWYGICEPDFDTEPGACEHRAAMRQGQGDISVEEAEKRAYANETQYPDSPFWRASLVYWREFCKPKKALGKGCHATPNGFICVR